MKEAREIPVYVLTHLRVIGPYALAVYLELLKRADGCYDAPTPFSAGSLVTSTQMSHKTIRKAIAILEELGLVAITGGKVNQHDSAGGSFVLIPKGCGQGVDSLPKRAHSSGRGLNPNATAPEPLFDTKPLVEPGAVDLDATAPSRARCSSSLRTKNSRPKVKRNDARIAVVFAHWNEAGIIRHRALLATTEAEIVRALAMLDETEAPETSLTEVLHAITNYATCLSDERCQWSHTWVLGDFLHRGLERFLDEAKPIQRERKAQKEAMRGNGHAEPHNPADKALILCAVCRDTGQDPQSEQPCKCSAGDVWREREGAKT